MPSYRAVWLSDLHLGSRGCQAEPLLAFLDGLDAVGTLYLVGDIVDFWAMRRAHYWPSSHDAVARRIIDLSHTVRIIYVLGNHDETLDFLLDYKFGQVEIVHDTSHTLLDGRRLWVVHGDVFDPIMLYHPLLAHLGSAVYEVLALANHLLKRVRAIFGRPHWSLANYLHKRAKKIGNFMRVYEAATTGEARRRGYDGVVCGHIHIADLKMVNGTLYANDGDGVDSCTALVETTDGELRHVKWNIVRYTGPGRREADRPMPALDHR